MSQQTKTILIAEDDTFIGKIIQKHLEQEGYDVDRAMNGVEALEKLSAKDYALILLDLIMPIKDGFDVLMAMKESKNTTPVLVFSNLSQDKDREEVLSLGAKDYYVKSNMTTKALAKMVGKYMA